MGVVAAVYVILNTVKNRRERAKKGYRQNSAAADYLKAVIIAALILAYCYMLSQYRGHLRHAGVGGGHLPHLQLHHR